MDPALRQLIAAGDPGEWVEAIIRQDPRVTQIPPHVRVVSRFSDIATVRVRRRDIERVWAHPGTASVKAARVLQFERPGHAGRADGDAFSWLSRRAERGTAKRGPWNDQGRQGEGVVVGVVDWGFDFAHRAFRDGQGGSRIDALWDQRGPQGHRSPRYGYGRVLFRRDLDAALRTPSPYATAAYHPADSDPGIGAHGTHVADIAAGTTRADGGGLAPRASLVCVHLASAPLTGLANLGDSVRLLEAIAFIADVAAGRPLVINLSVGRHGGPHTGLTLVEQAFDRFLEAAPNRMIVQSAGNYFQARTHAQGQVNPGGEARLRWRVSPNDATPNEFELWYSDRDDFDVTLVPPGGRETDGIRVGQGESRGLYGPDGAELGRAYHRAFDPNTPDHHFEAFLKPNAPPGEWTVIVRGRRVQDGRYHAWIERDGRGARQSRFASGDVSTASTIGSICNGFLTIAVGAAEVTPFGARPAPFASQGPTRDGRQKPDLSAPGVRVGAARSAPRGSSRPRNGATVMSGASQASPYVAGVAASLMSDSPAPKDIHSLRQQLFAAAETWASAGLTGGRTDRRVSRLGTGLIARREKVGSSEESVTTHPIPSGASHSALQSNIGGVARASNPASEPARIQQ